jgi:hypothetical protein
MTMPPSSLTSGAPRRRAGSGAGGAASAVDEFQRACKARGPLRRAGRPTTSTVRCMLVRGAPGPASRPRIHGARRGPAHVHAARLNARLVRPPAAVVVKPNKLGSALARPMQVAP